jgi:hypothetical protein
MTVTWAMLTNQALPPGNSNGTFDILGAFGPMRSPQFPCLFRPVFLCAWMAFSLEDAQREPATITISLTHEDGSLAGRWEQDLAVNPADDGVGARGPVSLPLYEFTLFRPGRHIVAAEFEGQRLWSTELRVELINAADDSQERISHRQRLRAIVEESRTD